MSLCCAQAAMTVTAILDNFEEECNHLYTI